VLEPIFRRDIGARRSEHTGSAADEGEDPDDDLSPQAVALRALKEIEFDRATGKLSDDDYETLKARYTAEALAALRTGGEMRDAGGVAAGATPHPASRIPDPASRIPHPASPIPHAVCPTHGPRPEADAQFCAECGARLASAPGYCSRCGTSLEHDARYCHSCGARVAA
jgi:hypothetical protein